MSTDLVKRIEKILRDEVSKFQFYQYKKSKSILQDALSNVILFFPGKDSSWYSTQYKALGVVTSHQHKLFIEKIKETIEIKSVDYIYLENKFIDESIFNDYMKIFDKKRVFIAFRSISGNQLDSLIKAIRNVFAHGNFILKDKTFFIWNIDHGIVKALIAISSIKLKRLINLFIN